MNPELRRIGNSHSPVVVIDDFSGSAEAVAELADALAPFPAPGHGYYPGVRRTITPGDAAANDYVERTCQDAAQFIAGAFDYGGFDLIEASFSIVTANPAKLANRQRAPHFDSTDPNYLAILHYLRVPEGSGTAFYRQRTTGIERVTERNLATFVRVAQADAEKLSSDSGYIQGSDEFYEQVATIDAMPDRLIIYPGSLLHSGIIPKGMPLSANPREGRLTANLFVRGH